MFNRIKNLFKKQTQETKTTGKEETESGSQRVNTLPLKLEEATKPLTPKDIDNILAQRTSKVEPPQLVSAVCQSAGLEREHNEDALFSLTTTLSTNDNSIQFGLYIVADGMGGHQLGEVASSTAIRAMTEHIIERLYLPLFGANPTIPEDSITEILENGISKAHQEILARTRGGGTTLTCVLILGNQMTIAHVGDSRAYHIAGNGTIETLTRDHSLVKRLEELGQITAEEAAVHPQRNVLYRALGQGEPFEPEILTSPLPKTGYLLICSDGLWGVVPEDVILEIINKNENPILATQSLVDAANAAGGPDNISVILVKLPSSE